jgi:hypothetical protein
MDRTLKHRSIRNFYFSEKKIDSQEKVIYF